VGTTLIGGDLMLSLSISISSMARSNVIANSTPGIRYSIGGLVTSTTIVEIVAPQNKNIKIKDLFVLGKKEYKTIASKNVLKYKKHMNVSPTIFGTTYDSKTFLTATSSLSIDKQDVSPLLDYPSYQFGMAGSLLVTGGVN